MSHPQTADTEKISTLNVLAWALRTEDTHRALALSREAVCLARAGGDQSGLAGGLCLLGACTSILAQYEEAQEALEESLTLSRSLGDLITEGRGLYYLGLVHWCRSEHTDAIKNILASQQVREELGDWEGIGAGYNVLGNIQYNLCDYGLALDWYTRGLEARQRAGDEAGVGGSLCNIGNVYGERGDYMQALGYHQRGLDQAVRTGNTALEMISLGGVGSDYVDLGRFDEGIEVCRRAVRLGKSQEKWGQAAAALTSLAFAYNKTGRQAEALDAYAEALEIARSAHDRKVAAHSLYSIGEILVQQGLLDDARARLTEASTLAQSIGARRTAFLAFQMLSEVCKRQGEYAAALGHYEEFRRLEKEVFTEDADDRAKALVIKMEVEHHRREAESLAEINLALQAANSRLEALATTDPLTGLPNHRALVAALDAQITRDRRGGAPSALLFLDIDHFKSFNDTYGHPVGDAVLAEFAACVRACLREEDLLGRWGGEEFLVLLPGTGAAEALTTGERVRAAVAGCVLSAIEGLHMTCSIGAAASPPLGASRTALVEAADQALYAAKRLGRNQVRLSGDPAILALDGPLFPNTPGDTYSGHRQSISPAPPPQPIPAA